MACEEVYMVDKASLLALLKDAANAHHEYEKQLGEVDANWQEWYADHIISHMAHPLRGFCAEAVDGDGVAKEQATLEALPVAHARVETSTFNNHSWQPMDYSNSHLGYNEAGE